jgi:hypothetical protein
MNLNLSRISRIAAAALALAGLPAWSFLIPGPDPARITVEEYMHDLGDGRGHFFLLSDAGEKQFIDSGQAGPGWRATGHRFGAYVAGSGRAAGKVCRFYAPGPVTHFYTASVAECEALRTHDLGWNYEGIRFEIDVPSGGACAVGLAPIHRLFNARPQFNDSNHRYVADDAIRASLVASGWVDEGLVFCATSAEFVPAKRFDAAAGAIRPVADCENEDLGGGGCIALNGIAGGMENRIGPYLPDLYIHPNPQWSDRFGALTGYTFDLFTAQPPGDTDAVAAHSFVQRGFDAHPVLGWGFHVAGVDRIAGALGSIEPMFQFWTRPPGAGAADVRVFPWRTTRENALDLTFGLGISTVRRADSASHGYGAPMIVFRDVKSGGTVGVSMLTYATFPPGDFVGAMDPATGLVIVSTTFGARATFGKSVSGEFIACDGTNPCTLPQSRYTFRLTRDDFARIVAMARAPNPALSTDVNDYLLVNVRFRNGIVNDAEVGVIMSSFSLLVFGY